MVHKSWQRLYLFSRLVTLEEDKGKAIEELVDYFDSKIKDKNGALEQVKMTTIWFDIHMNESKRRIL